MGKTVTILDSTGSPQSVFSPDPSVTTTDGDITAIAAGWTVPDPTANTSGTATVTASVPFLLRWLVKGLQNVYANLLLKATEATLQSILSRIPSTLDNDRLPISLGTGQQITVANAVFAAQSQTTTTTTAASVAVTATAGVALAANANRKSAVFVNTGTSNITLRRVASGSTITAGAGLVLAPNGTYEINNSNIYLGDVLAICATGQTSTLAIEEGA